MQTRCSDLPEPNWGVFFAPDVRGRDPLVSVGCGPVTVAQGCRGGRPVYLATPYSREVLGINGAWDYRKSYDQKYGAAKAALNLMRVGITAVSPIVMSAEIVHASMTDVAPVPTIDPLDAALWEAWCRPILNNCCAVVVPDLPGWQRSRGIWHEVCRAVERLMPVYVYAGFLE